MGTDCTPVPTIYVLSKNKKNITFFYQKNTIFTAVKNCRILHRHVCVMTRVDVLPTALGYWMITVIIFV